MYDHGGLRRFRGHRLFAKKFDVEDIWTPTALIIPLFAHFIIYSSIPDHDGDDTVFVCTGPGGPLFFLFPEGGFNSSSWSARRSDIRFSPTAVSPCLDRLAV